MNEKYKNFKDLLKSILIHLNIENKCILNLDNTVKEINECYNPSSFFIDIQEDKTFIFKGTLVYLANHIINLVKNSSESFGNLSLEKQTFILQSLDRIKQCIEEQEIVRFWTLKISIEFKNIYDKHSSKLNPICTKEEFEILELEAESWISQIKNLLSLKNIGAKSCLNEEKLFWYHFKENLEILESFYFSNQFKFLYRIISEKDMLILQSTFDSFKNLNKYKQLSAMFLSYYNQFDLTFLSYNSNINIFKNGLKETVKIILNTFDKQPKPIKDSILKNLYSLFHCALSILKQSDLVKDFNDINCILSHLKNLYKKLFNSNQLDLDEVLYSEQSLSELIRSIFYFDFIVCEYFIVINVEKIVNTFSDTSLKSLELLNFKSKEYLSYLESKFRNLKIGNSIEEIVKFDEFCIDLVIECFKEVWNSNLELSNKRNNEQSIQTQCPFLTSTESIDWDNKMKDYLSILSTFKVFLNSPKFLQCTIVERSKILDYLDKQLLIFYNNIQRDENSLIKEIPLYIGLLCTVDFVFYNYFEENVNLVLKETIKQKINMVEENLILRINQYFEDLYLYLNRIKVKEIIFVTINNINEEDYINSLIVLDLTKEYKLIERQILLSELLQTIRTGEITLSFIDKITNSYFFILVQQEIKPILEFRTNYYKYNQAFEQFKLLLNNRIYELEMFGELIDKVFEEIKKVYNLKVKYLIYSDNRLYFIISKLTNEYNIFQIMITKLNLHKKFGGSFTFNSKDCCLDFGHPDTLFYRTCIEYSYDTLVVNYLTEVVRRLHNNYYFKEIKISETGYVNLNIIYELLDEIFPRQEEESFFDALHDNVKLSYTLKCKIEEVLDTFNNLKTNLYSLLDYFFKPIEEKKILKKIEIYKKKILIVNGINENKFPLVKFNSSLQTKTYECILIDLNHQLEKKYKKTIKKILKEGRKFQGIIQTNNNVVILGEFVDFYTNWFIKKVKGIKRIKDSKNNLPEFEGLLKIEEISKEFRECLLNLKDKKDLLLKEIEIEKNTIYNKFKNLKEESNAFDKIKEFENKLDKIDVLLIFLGTSTIDRTKFVTFKKEFDEHLKVKEIILEWNYFCSLPVNIVDLQTLFLLFEKIRKDELSHYKEIFDILKHYDLIKQLPSCLQDFVTIEYFNKELILSDYLTKFTVDGIIDIINVSEIDFKTVSALNRIKKELSDAIYLKDEVVLNFDEIENTLFDLLAECNAVENYSKLEKYKKEIKELHEIIYKLIQINTNLKDIQNINLDIKRLTNSEVFDVYEIEKINELTNNLFILSNDKLIYVKEFVNKENIIDDLKRKVIQIQIKVKQTLNKYREQVHRLYFVSDEDILNLLCNRTNYSDILIQIYNINEIIIEDNFIVGFISGIERIILIQKIDLSLKMAELFTSFSNSFSKTIEIYLMNKLKNILKDSEISNSYYKELYDYCNVNDLQIVSPNNKISVIDEFVNEFCYFNNFKYTKSIKIDFIESNSKWKKDIHLLYPKPKIINNKLVTENLKYNLVYLEYYPPSDIVFTTLTSTIFSLISLGLSKSSGVILFGKSGTGKTETVKYYCRTILRPVYVFCCSEECDIVTLENIIKGCINVGAYLCLDEFNRLDKNTMSSVTELIYQHKEEVKFFLTMNLGYFGRNNLPKSLKSIFTEIKVDNPNVIDIVKIFIPRYATEIMQFLKELEINCEKLGHYNFGLRAINTIRNIKLTTDDLITLTGIKVPEHEVILYSIYLFYYSTLSRNDKKLLKDTFKTIFRKELTTTISLEHIFTFGINSSTGILIYSKFKTDLIEKMAQMNNNVILEFYNPLNTTNFFGGYDEITGEWNDGEFVTSLKQDKKVWYVFDCVLDSTWIENFNSVLDDNKSLCLKSGEIVKIKPNQKFIFEGNSLDKLTPASLTRLFTIYLEDKENYNVNYKTSDEFSTLIEKERVVFLTGIGKYTFLDNYFKNDLIVVDSTDRISDCFYNLFNKNELIWQNNKKIFFTETKLYIERFELASLSLQEMIREYLYYGKIGDVYPSNLKIICGIDSGEIQERLANKSCIVRVEQEELELYITNLFKLEFENKISLENDFEIFKKALAKACKENLFDLKNIDKFLNAFKLALSMRTKELPCDIFYFVSLLFCKEEVFRDCLVNELSFSIEKGFYKSKQRCLKDFISFILTIKQPIVIIGPNLSGKNNLIRDFTVQDFKIFNFYDELYFDEKGIYLLNDFSKVPKMILRKSIILDLDVPDSICVDYKSFYNTLNKKGGEYAVYAMHKKEEKMKFNCTCLKLPKFRKIFKKEDFLREISTKGEVVFFNDLYTKTQINENCMVIFDSLFKYKEFIEIIEKIFKESQINYENRKNHLQECYKRISEFKTQASNLLCESIKKKNQLEQLQIQIKNKMDKMVGIQIQMKVEKERIIKNQNELNTIFNKSLEKKKLIDIRMKDILPLIEQSKNKISTISKKHLAEIKTMVKPPEVIKFVIELVYAMLEDSPLESINWTFLMQYIRKEDFMNKILNFSGIGNLSNLESILKGKTIELSKAYNASQACGILYEWIMANYEYKKVQIEIQPLLEETEVIEREIKIIKEDLEEEENNYKELENEINKNKEEYSKLKLSLEEIKVENVELEKKQSLINNVIKMIHDEKDKWHIEEPEDPLKNLLKSPNLLLKEKKNIFISKNQKIEEQFKERGFLKTSTKHKNFLQVLRNVIEYNSDVIVSDVDQFYPQIYKLLKYQILTKTFSIILISNLEHNFHAHCTFQMEIKERFSFDNLIDLEKYEQKFIDTIVNYKDMESIIESKSILDIKVKEFKESKDKIDHLNNLNLIYSELDLDYKRAFGFGLSFNIFKEYLDRKDLKDYFSKGLPSNTTVLDIKKEFKESKEDLTIITSQEEIIFEIERCISFNKSISAGSKKNNEKIIDFLIGSDENNLYLIKNINLLKDKTVKKENLTNRFLFVVEEGAYHNLIASTRILYSPSNFDLKETYLNILGEEEREAVEFHCRQVEKIPVSFKDLYLLIKSKKEIGEEYLKYLLYDSKL